MNRRAFLAFIGLAPLAPFAANAADAWGRPVPSLAPLSEPLPGRAIFARYEPREATFFAATETKIYRLDGAKWRVCENHPDKAWPAECDCGPGMQA